MSASKSKLRTCLSVFAGVLFGGLTAGVVASAPSIAAEELSVRFRGAQRSIEIADLETYVNTGEIPRSLRWYTEQLTEEQLEGLREILQQPLAVEPRVVTRFTSSTVGEALLRRLIVIFWGGPNDEALFRALRSSLVLASVDEEGVTIMNVMRKYPLSTIRLDLGIALRAADDLKEIFIDSDRIFVAIKEKGATGITEETLPPDFVSAGEAGSLEWQVSELTLVNPLRDAGETVLANLYLPTGLSEPAPLAVISHGVASDRQTFAYLAEHLASHGFAVGVLEHPDTDRLRFQQYAQGFAEEPDPQFFIQRPRDITVLLDEIESNAEFSAQVLTDRVGVLGQSLGGYTVLASGGAELDFNHLEDSCQEEREQILPFNLSYLLQCRLEDLAEDAYQLRDPRIAAVLAINPISSAVFGPVGLGQMEVPVMMVAGSHDFVAPAVNEQIVPFSWLTTEDRFLVLVENGTHFSFLSEDAEAAFDLPQDLIGPSPSLAYPAMNWMATTFFDAFIRNNAQSEAFLSELLLPSRTGDFEYALTRSLTETDIEEAVSGR